MAVGLNSPYKIDAILRHPTTLEVTLLLVVDEQLNEKEADSLLKLQRKLNNYLAYALDGELLREHPEFKGHPIRIEAQLMDIPDEGGIEFLNNVHGICEANQVAFDFLIQKPT